MTVQITLRTRLAMLVVAAIVPLFGLSIFKALHNTGAAVERAQTDLQFAASLAAVSQQRVAETARQVLTAIANVSDIRDGKVARCDRYLGEMRRLFPLYANLGIVGADGYSRCHGLDSSHSAYLGDRAYFRDAVARRGFVVGEYILGRLSGKPSITFALPVLDGDGRVSFVAYASLDLAEMSKSVDGIQMPPGATLGIYDRNGSLLAGTPDLPIRVGQKAASPVLREAVKTMSQGVREGVDAKGQNRLWAFMPSSPLADAAFFVAVSIDCDLVLEPGQRQLWLELAALALVAFLGGGLAWLVAGRSIVRPATEILQATRQVRKGQLDVRIPIRSLDGGGEFAKIAEGFNLMTDSLQQRQRDLDLELARSRQAYVALELTINSMHEGLMAVDAAGRFLLVNEPAKQYFSVDEEATALTQRWSREQGLFVPGTETPFPLEEMPLFRALRGESGGPIPIFVKNDRQPQGRLLNCSFRPMQTEGGIRGALAVFTDITEVERLQLEQAENYAQLRETQRRLLDAQRMGRIGVWELDIRTQELWLSDELYDLYGVARGSADGNIEKLLDLVHPEDRKRYWQQRRAMRQAGPPIEVEYRIITAAGELRWLYQFDRVQTDREGHALYRTGVVQEITERKRAELLIARSTEMLNRTGELARVGGWEVDAATLTPYWSEAIYRIHELNHLQGLGFEAAIGFYAPEVQPVIRAAVEAALHHATPWDLEAALITATGRRIWVRTQGRALLQDGKVVRLVGVLHDITEQHESQAQLRLLETSVSRLNDIVLITEAESFDEPDPRIVFVNDAFQCQTGYSREEVLGKSPRLLQGAKTQRAELDRISAALKGGQPVRAELINYTKSGNEFWTELDIAPVADFNGRFTHSVAVSRDITHRKLTERALIDSEQRYAALFETAPLPMWVYDIDSWRFLTVNQAAVQGYGFSVQEFLAMTLFDIRPEADHELLRKQLAGMASERNEVLQHRRKDASLFPVNVFSKPIQYAGRPARFVVALDVTAQVKAEKDAQEHLFTLQRAADAAQAITWHQKLDDMLQEVAEQARGVIGAHQAVVSLTQGGNWAQSITALSLSDKYSAYRDLIAASDGSGVYALVCETNRSLRMTQAELEVHPRWRGFGEHADKHSRMRGWLAVPLLGRSGNNIGLLQLSDKYEGEFTAQDEYVAMELAQLASIAIQNARLLDEVGQLNAGLEQKVAERTVALARQEALFRTLAEQAPEVVWTNSPDGRATYFNRAWLELVGGEMQDWTGTQWLAAIHPEDLPDIQASWQSARAKRSHYAGVRRVRDKDGGYHTMSYRASPVLDEQGEVVFWVGIDANITEIKAIEAALRLSNQELEAFSYSVSHDLRSPLNTIDGFSRLLGKQIGSHAGNGDAKIQHYLSRIQVGVAQMGQLIDGLLTLAHVSRMQLLSEPVSLSALAQAILKEWQARNPERRVELHIESALQAHGDGRLVKVVMENLLNNAWKFSSQKDRATIRVGQKFDAAGLPVFFVSDNGAGFDMAYADKLFNPFQRLHAVSEFPGTGVGLATVSRVIGRHGGRLWAESAPGRGATFFFTLPKVPVPI